MGEGREERGAEGDAEDHIGDVKGDGVDGPGGRHV